MEVPLMKEEPRRISTIFPATSELDNGLHAPRSGEAATRLYAVFGSNISRILGPKW